MRAFSRQRLLSPDKGLVASDAELVRLLAWVVCGQAHRANHEGVADISVGASDALCAPLDAAGATVLMLEAWAQSAIDTCQTAEAVARECLEVVNEARRCVLALAQIEGMTLLRMVHETRIVRRRVDLLRRVVEEGGCDAVRLVDSVGRLHEEERLLQQDVEFVERWLSRATEPLCRMAGQLMTHGSVAGTDRDGLFDEKGPRVLAPHWQRLQCLARTVDLLHRMEESVASSEGPEMTSVDSVVHRLDALYSRECRRLVALVLHERGGLAVARKLRQSFGKLPETVEWPVSEVLATEAVRPSYRAVGVFVKSLQQCREDMSRVPLVGTASFVRFRQKALHVLSCFFNSIVALRLNHDVAWEAWEPLLLRCADFEQLRATHTDLVQKLSDLCLQNAASRPLRKAVQQAIVCCNDFVLCGGEHVDVIEPAFDASVLLFRRLIAGILQQRKIAHLVGLQTSLEFNREEGEAL
jgi:hypothetical protein